MEDPHDLARAIAQAGESGHGAVARHATPRYLLEDSHDAESLL
jgi:hypothetical protein